MIEVWLVDPEEPAALPSGLLSIVDRSEYARSRLLQIPHDRRNFLISRILLRLALSRQLGGDPRDWQFIVGKTGKVRLAYRPGSELVDFSISHAEGIIGVALSPRGPVGLDLERIPTGEKGVAGLHDLLIHFTATEAAALARFPEAERPGATVTLWSMKEAYAKYLGTGVETDFSGLKLPGPGEVSLWTRTLTLPDRKYSLALVADPGETARVQNVSLRELELPEEQRATQ
jgi:phosphopantetheinyl transferase